MIEIKKQELMDDGRKRPMSMHSWYATIQALGNIGGGLLRKNAHITFFKNHYTLKIALFPDWYDSIESINNILFTHPIEETLKGLWPLPNIVLLET